MILMNLSFQDEFLLIVVDKLFIGICLILLGLAGKWIFEKYRTRQTLLTEVNKLRVSKIGECWSIHSKYSSSLNEFIETLNKYRDSDKTDEEIVESLAPKVDSLKQLKREVENITASHKFWLGDTIHDEVLEFNKSFPDFCDVFHQGKFDRCIELKRDMDKKMLDVDQVLLLLNKKINT